jgi:hypothetical protein
LCALSVHHAADYLIILVPAKHLCRIEHDAARPARFRNANAVRYLLFRSFRFAGRLRLATQLGNRHAVVKLDVRKRIALE